MDIFFFFEIGFIEIRMVRIGVRTYAIRCYPTWFATHVRVMVDEDEVMFINDNQSPGEAVRSKSRPIIDEIWLGKVTARAYRRARRLVDPHFCGGTFSIFTHNCAMYAFRLCSALIDGEVMQDRFPKHCNVLIWASTGWDGNENKMQQGPWRASAPEFRWRHIVAALRAAHSVISLPESDLMQKWSRLGRAYARKRWQDLAVLSWPVDIV